MPRRPVLRRRRPPSGPTRSRRTRAPRCRTSRSRRPTAFMLIFTSGTTGAPKAVRMSHGRLAGWGSQARGDASGSRPDDVCYSVDAAVPLERGGRRASRTSLASGATAVLRRRFSASGFLPDVRKYGVTFFNYVGKPLTLHPRDARAARRRRQPAAHRVRQRGRAARHRPVRATVRLHRRRRLRLDRGRHRT